MTKPIPVPDGLSLDNLRTIVNAMEEVEAAANAYGSLKSCTFTVDLEPGEVTLVFRDPDGWTVARQGDLT